MTSISKPTIHPTAVVDPGAELGPGAQVWHFCHVMPGARIGARSMLGQGCFVGGGVRVGSGVRVQNHVSLFEGVELEDEVFVGPGVVFTNVVNPRAAFPKRDEFRRTLVRRGATIGANATILPGVVLGEYSFVGAGALVRDDVPDHALVVGVPARPSGFVSRRGERLEFSDGVATCTATGERYALADDRVRLIDVRAVADV
ncbi:MAG TPA: acyltransferase [Polyangiaceae bacterium]|nr:acyltransferase [Polyangiaceae bacterium]